jgi:hypothetical protein
MKVSVPVGSGRKFVLAPAIDAVIMVLAEQVQRDVEAADSRTVSAGWSSVRRVPLSRRFRRRLLACGILASVLWVGTDVLAGTLSENYSFVSQSSSELSSPGAPTRSLVVLLGLTYDALMVAFGLGVWGSGEKRALRLTAAMVIGNVLLGGLAVLFFPMHPDEPTSTSANTMNVIVMASGMVCFLLAMGVGAVAFRDWFRYYSIGTLAAYGVLTIAGMVLGSQNPQRTSVGIQERTMVLGYLLWVALLAVALLRAEKESGVPGV